MEQVRGADPGFGVGHLDDRVPAVDTAAGGNGTSDRPRRGLSPSVRFTERDRKLGRHRNRARTRTLAIEKIGDTGIRTPGDHGLDNHRSTRCS